MKTFQHLLPLAALGSAFILPDNTIFEHLAIEPKHREPPVNVAWKHVKESVASIKDDAQITLDDALSSAQGLSEDVVSWSKDKTDDAWDVIDSLREHHGPHHPHHPPPGHGRPPPDHEHPPHHGKPPHHGPHHKSNKTVYQLISESKYTTTLAKLINDFPDLVETLNSTEANYTVFAPTDKAFGKIPEHAPKPDKKHLEELLKYHVSADFYPAGRVLSTHTIPSLLNGDHLASEPRPQRLSIHIGLKGLTVNFYSRIVAIDIFGSNGVIHGVDSVLVPPPKVVEIIDLLPSEFSTLELALAKTDLLDTLNSTAHPGGTFFAPSNFAFKKLGPKINMFLFSSHGKKYLKALLKYHVAHGTTLYSDAAYVSDSDDESMAPSDLISKYSFLNKKPCHKKSRKSSSSFFKREARKMFAPASISKRHEKRSGHHDDNEARPKHHFKKGYHHYDLPTWLGDKKLNVDVVRYGPYIGMKVNGFSRVVIQDGIARDGVIQTVSDVLIPPHGDYRRHGGMMGAVGKVKSMLGMEKYMCLEAFKARFAGLVEED